MLTVAFTLFFTSVKVQSHVANSITKRINTSFETNIGIGAARIDLMGALRLNDVIIKDHHQDTLFYAKEIQLNLEEFEAVLKGNYTFSSLKIQQPFLAIRTYEAEEDSNLMQFLQKLKRKDQKKSKLFANVNALAIDNARLLLLNENKGTSLEFNALNTSLSTLVLEEKKLSGKITTLSYHSPQFEDIEEVTADFLISSTAIEIPTIQLKSPNLALSAALVLNSPQWSKEAIIEKGVIDIQLSEASFATEIFKTKTTQLPKGKIKLNGQAKGPFTQLKVLLKAQSDRNSVFEGDFLVDCTNSADLTIQGKQILADVTQHDLNRYSAIMFQESNPLNTINLERFSLKGNFDYLHEQLFSSSMTLEINQGQLSSKTRLTKKEDSWELNQQFLLNQFGKGNLFRSQPLLQQINGIIDLEGNIERRKITFLNWESQLSSIVWNRLAYNDITINGTTTPKQVNLSVQVEDDRLKLKAKLLQGLNDAQNKLLIESSIEGIDLSAFGWTPPDDAVRFATNLTVHGTQNSLEEVRFENTQIANKIASSSFNDFSLYFSRVEGRNKLTQDTSDLFQFSLDGNFTYGNLPFLVEDALREALLLPRKKVFQQKEEFNFELALNKKTLQALYPAIATPKDIELKGEISTVKGSSSFSVDLPFIAYQGYDIEGLSLTTSANATKDRTRFKADNLTGKNIKISNLSLITSQIDDFLTGEFVGQFGQKTNNDFSLNFTYRQTDDATLFQFNKVLIDLEGDLWSLSPEKQNSFRYDSQEGTFVIQDLALMAGEQAIQIDGRYQSKSDFSLQLNTNQLSIEKILPKGDKFNLKGGLSTNVSLVQNETLQIFQTDLTIDGLVINGTSMGDFSLVAGGSSQLKTYRLNTGLLLNGKEILKGVGNLYIPSGKPRLDIDLQLLDLDLSFLSALGKDKLTDIEGFLTGDLNLWGTFGDLKLSGEGRLNQWGMFIPSTNAHYVLANDTRVSFRDRVIDFNNAQLIEKNANTVASLNGYLSHVNFNSWAMDLQLATNRFLVYDRPEDENALFYGKGFLTGEAHFTGPTKSLQLEVVGSTSKGTTLVIPWKEDKGLSDTSFIDFLSKGAAVEEEITADISSIDEAFRGFEMVFDLDVNRNAEVEIVVDQSSGSTLSGRGAGNILIETNIDGKFNIWGDFITYEGVYNFKNLGLIDKKFAVEQGGTIVWEGDPLEAQLNIEATYQVPGGANPALLVDNPNFNRKIPTNVGIQLVGNLIKPDDPVFDISFPNTTGIVVSEINYRLADEQRRQLQAISLLSQGIFISDVSVSFQGITNNLYEKASDVFSTLLGSNQGKLNVGLNYLQGEENPAFDLRTEDRIGLTLSTQISDRILINGKIGVPIDGVEQSVIVGDVQIDFILNESGSLKAKVFNRENDFRYLGDEFGYTQGMGMSYQVDFNTFQELLQRITTRATESSPYTINQPISGAIEFANKKN